MTEEVAQPIAVDSGTDDSEFVADMRPALIAFFQRRTATPPEAEDLAHDVMLRALTHKRWSTTEQARGYIFRIALNRWRDRGRRKLAHGTVVDWNEEFAEGIADEISPERVLIHQQRLDAIVSALRELGVRTRDIFLLYRMEGMKQADIARRLGISVSAVEKHLAKALSHLARRLNAEGFA